MAGWGPPQLLRATAFLLVPTLLVLAVQSPSHDRTEAGNREAFADSVEQGHHDNVQFTLDRTGDVAFVSFKLFNEDVHSAGSRHNELVQRRNWENLTTAANLTAGPTAELEEASIGPPQEEDAIEEKILEEETKKPEHLIPVEIVIGSLLLNVIFALVTAGLLTKRYKPRKPEKEVQVDKHSVPEEAKAAADAEVQQLKATAAASGLTAPVSTNPTVIALGILEKIALTQLAYTVKKSTSKSSAHWYKGYKERHVAIVPMGGSTLDGTPPSRLELWHNGFFGWWETEDDFKTWCKSGKPAPKGSLSISGLVNAHPVHEAGKDGYVLLQHEGEDDHHDMYIVFASSEASDKWVHTLQEFKSKLGETLTLEDNDEGPMDSALTVWSGKAEDSAAAAGAAIGQSAKNQYAKRGEYGAAIAGAASTAGSAVSATAQAQYAKRGEYGAAIASGATVAGGYAAAGASAAGGAAVVAGSAVSEKAGYGAGAAAAPP